MRPRSRCAGYDADDFDNAEPIGQHAIDYGARCRADRLEDRRAGCERIAPGCNLSAEEPRADTKNALMPVPKLRSA